MSQQLRQGKVLRHLPHGTVMVWDTERKAAFPYYPKPHESTPPLDADVTFTTDAEDRIVVTLELAP